jgi:hypothetical protein
MWQTFPMHAFHWSTQFPLHVGLPAQALMQACSWLLQVTVQAEASTRVARAAETRTKAAARPNFFRTGTLLQDLDPPAIQGLRIWRTMATSLCAPRAFIYSWMQVPLQLMMWPLQRMLQLSMGPQGVVAQLRTVRLGQRTVVVHAAAVAGWFVVVLAAIRAAASNRTLDSVRIIDSSF